VRNKRWIIRSWNCGSIRIEDDGSRMGHLMQAKSCEWRYKEKKVIKTQYSVVEFQVMDLNAWKMISSRAWERDTMS